MEFARMTVLVTPEQKAAIHDRARILGISTGEMVRRAVESFGAFARSAATAEREAVLGALANELQRAAGEAKAALVTANREMRSTLRQLAQHRHAAP